MIFISVQSLDFASGISCLISNQINKSVEIAIFSYSIRINCDHLKPKV